MTIEAPFLDFENFNKLDLIKKYEYFHTNKVFSEVYTVQQKNNGKIYLANISRPEEKKNHSKAFKRVVNILPQLNHPSILHFIGYSKFNQDGKSHSAVITDYYPNGTLNDMLIAEKLGKPVSGWNDTKKLIALYGIASGMAYLHSKNILHRNLKPTSILMDNSFYPKIRNFNLLIKCDDESRKKPIKGTPEYMACEIIMREPSSKPMDVYSFAMIAYEIVTLRHPFEEIENLNIIRILQKVRNGQYPEFNDSTPKAFRKLIERCWAKNPEERPTFDEITHLLRTDSAFITDGVEKDEYFEYVKYVDNFSNEIRKENINKCLSEEDAKIINEEIQKKTEENVHLQKEIEILKRNLDEEKKKVRKIIKLKDQILSSSNDETKMSHLVL